MVIGVWITAGPATTLPESRKVVSYRATRFLPTRARLSRTVLAAGAFAEDATAGAFSLVIHAAHAALFQPASSG